MDIRIITAPLIGGLIGLITNSLAIKMLFRPYKELKIGGLRVPFTPGLIPKEKPRIAHAIAQVISSYILDQDTILAALASDPIRQAYETWYAQKWNAWKASELIFSDFLRTYQWEEPAEKLKIKVSDSISNYLVQLCKEEELVRKLVEQSFEQFKDQMNPWMYKMGKKPLHATQEAMIVRAEAMIAEHGKEYIEKYMNNVYEEWLDHPVSEVALLLEKNIPDLRDQIWNQYAELVQNKVGNFLATLNVARIIENKINDYDLNELETMIMEISKKELQALVWLGGLLGMIMGFVNLIF